MNEIWTLLWSKKQKCFHIERASDLCRKNANAMLLIKEINDYHPVMIGTRAECDHAAAEWRCMLDAKDHARPTHTHRKRASRTNEAAQNQERNQ